MTVNIEKPEPTNEKEKKKKQKEKKEKPADSREEYNSAYDAANAAVGEIGDPKMGVDEYTLATIESRIKHAEDLLKVAKGMSDETKYPKEWEKLDSLQTQIAAKNEELQQVRAQAEQKFGERFDDAKKIIEKYVKKQDTDNELVIQTMTEDLENSDVTGVYPLQESIVKLEDELLRKKEEQERKIAEMEEKIADLKSGEYVGKHGEIIKGLEEELAELEEAGGNEEEINKLSKEIAQEKADLKRATEDSAKFITDLEEAIKKSNKEQAAEEKRQRKVIEDKQKEIEQKQEKAAKAAFESIKSGEFKVENGAGFDEFEPGNLKDITGVKFELQKHELAMQKYALEAQTLDLGMQGMQAEYDKFEEEKGNVGWGKGIKIGGGLLAGGVLGAGAGIMLGGVGTATMVAAAPIVVAGATIVGAVFAVKNLWSAASRKLGNKKKATAWKNGSIIGWLTGENRVAKEHQEEKIKFETKYDEASAALKQKITVLDDHGKQIHTAASNSKSLLDNQIKDLLEKKELNDEINGLYIAVGKKPADYQEEIADIKKAKAEQIISENGSEIMADLSEKSDLSENYDKNVFDTYGTDYLEGNENHLDGLNFQAADIGDYTFGALGKFLKKGSDLPIVGGFAKSIGELSEGFNMVISEPERILSGVGKLVGIGLEEGETAGQMWGGMWHWLRAKESWDKADSVGDYWNALTEMGTNAFILFGSFGTRGAMKAGYLEKVGIKTTFTGEVTKAAKYLNRKGFIKTSKFVDRVSIAPTTGVKTVLEPFTGTYKAIKNEGLWNATKTVGAKGLEKVRGIKNPLKRAGNKSRGKLSEANRAKYAEEFKQASEGLKKATTKTEKTLLKKKINRSSRKLNEHNNAMLSEDIQVLKNDKRFLEELTADSKVFNESGKIDGSKWVDVNGKLKQDIKINGKEFKTGTEIKSIKLDELKLEVDNGIKLREKAIMEFKKPYEKVGEPSSWDRFKRNKEGNPAKKTVKERIFGKKKGSKVDLKVKGVEKLEKELSEKIGTSEEVVIRSQLSKAESLETSIIKKASDKIKKLFNERKTLSDEVTAGLDKYKRPFRKSRTDKISDIDGEIAKIKKEAVDAGVRNEKLIENLSAQSAESAKFFKTEFKTISKAKELKGIETKFETGQLKITNKAEGTTKFINEKGVIELNGKEYFVESFANDGVHLKEILKKNPKGAIKELGNETIYKNEAFENAIKEGKIKSLKPEAKIAKAKVEVKAEVKNPAKKPTGSRKEVKIEGNKLTIKEIKKNGVEYSFKEGNKISIKNKKGEFIEHEISKMEAGSSARIVTKSGLEIPLDALKKWIKEGGIKLDF